MRTQLSYTKFLCLLVFVFSFFTVSYLVVVAYVQKTKPILFGAYGNLSWLAVSCHCFFFYYENVAEKVIRKLKCT